MTCIAIDVRLIRSAGIRTVLINVLPRLLALRPQWRIRFLGDPEILNDLAFTRQANAEIIPFTAPLYSIAEQSNWPAKAARGSDLVWSPNYNIPLRWNGPLLVTINDIAHIAVPDVFGGLAKQLYARTMFQRARRRADAIVFISEFSKTEFRTRVGAPRGREFVAYCGVEEAWFHVDPGAALRAKPYILFVGSVKPHKNLSRLLSAFAQISDQIPHDLLIVGRKEGFITGDHNVRDMVDKFGGRVVFTGQVSDAELRRYFAQASALVLASLYEGFGLPPLEAMAVGCPSLVSRATSLPEVCGEASLYCDPLDVSDIASALKRILTDEILRSRLSKLGFAQARRFNWDASAQGYLSAIESVLADTNRATGETS
jgi:glycosyltransferase involved in cell wall biosynthesis